MSEQDAIPSNSLEQALAKAKQDPDARNAFFTELMGAQVVVLAARPQGAAADLTSSGNLLVLTNAAGKTVVPVFTGRDKAAPWHERHARYQYGLFVPAAALIQGLGPDVGLVVNPGHAIGVEMPSEVVGALRQQV